MNTEPSRPPALATWLLQHMSSRKDQEVLTGDLLERFGEGESDRWFWRQVLMAILVGVSREFRTHWPQIFFSIVGAPVLWFCAGRFLGLILANPIVRRAWEWGAGMQWPMSAVYDLGFRSAVAALMIQPILAALLLMDRAFRWVNLLRTLFISVPLIAATVVIWTLSSSPGMPGVASSMFWVSMILFTQLVSAWVGCRTAPDSTISGDRVLLTTTAVFTGLATGYLLHAVSGMGEDSWWALEQLNRHLAHTYASWFFWSCWIIPLEMLITSAACGWIARRLNRKYHRTMLVMVLISWAVLFGYSTFSYWYKIVADSIDHPWFRSYLGDHMARFFSAIVGTFIGGLWSAPNESASPPVTNADNPLATY